MNKLMNEFRNKNTMLIQGNRIRFMMIIIEENEFWLNASE